MSNAKILNKNINPNSWVLRTLAKAVNLPEEYLRTHTFYKGKSGDRFAFVCDKCDTGILFDVMHVEHVKGHKRIWIYSKMLANKNVSKQWFLRNNSCEKIAKIVL